MERLNQILERLEEIENLTLDQEKIDKMLEINREKDSILSEYKEKYKEAYNNAFVNKEKIAILN